MIRYWQHNHHDYHFKSSKSRQTPDTCIQIAPRNSLGICFILSEAWKPTWLPDKSGVATWSNMQRRLFWSDFLCAGQLLTERCRSHSFQKSKEQEPAAVIHRSNLWKFVENQLVSSLFICNSSAKNHQFQWKEGLHDLLTTKKPVPNAPALPIDIHCGDPILMTWGYWGSMGTTFKFLRLFYEILVFFVNCLILLGCLLSICFCSWTRRSVSVHFQVPVKNPDCFSAGSLMI